MCSLRLLSIIYYRQKHQRVLIPANISFSDSSSEDALAGTACCTMAQQVAESIHAAVNAITRAYTSIPDKVSQVQCILSGYLGLLLLCLQRRLSQLSEGIEIINGILQCCQSIFNLMHMYGEILSTSTATSKEKSIQNK